MITNDMISKGPAEITTEMESLVLKIHWKRKPKSVIISAAPPVKDPQMNCAISITNAMCRKFANRSKLSVFVFMIISTTGASKTNVSSFLMEST